MTRYTIPLDAIYDLWMAGRCTCLQCVSSYAQAFRAAAKARAAERGCDIAVVECTYGSSASQLCDTSYTAADLWQSIRDRTKETPCDTQN